MQYQIIPCHTMQYHAIPCNTMQNHAIPCNTMQYHAITCNTMQYYAIQCNTLQYHASLITADGAYHCPVGSIMAIFIKNITTSTQCAAVRTKFSDIREPPQNLAEKPRRQKYEAENKHKQKRTLCKISTRHHR